MSTYIYLKRKFSRTCTYSTGILLVVMGISKIPKHLRFFWVRISECCYPPKELTCLVVKAFLKIRFFLNPRYPTVGYVSSLEDRPSTIWPPAWPPSTSVHLDISVRCPRSTKGALETFFCLEEILHQFKRSMGSEYTYIYIYILYICLCVYVISIWPIVVSTENFEPVVLERSPCIVWIPLPNYSGDITLDHKF